MNATSPKDFAAALQKKKKRGHRQLLLKWGVAVGILLVGGFLLWLLAFSPVFNVKDVTVSGTNLVSKDTILETAQVPEGTSVFVLDTGPIAERLRALPAVRDVEISKDLPSTISIAVVERTLVFQRVEGEVVQWVDAEGVVFSTSADPTEGIPQAVTSDGDARLLQDVATVVVHIPEALIPRVVGLQAKAVDRITLELDDGALVVWGSSEESQLKADVLMALLPVGADVYDVSAPSHPITK